MESTIGSRVKQQRIARGFSQRYLAHLVGVVLGENPPSQQTIGQIETDEIKNPRKLDAIAKALGTSERYLRFGESCPSKAGLTYSLSEEALEFASFYQTLQPTVTELLPEGRGL